MSEWSVEKSRDTYNIRHWGDGFFDLNEAGQIIVRPDAANNDHEIILSELVKQIQKSGLGLPVLVRFSEILKSRVKALSGAFANAIEEFDYRGGYTPVYPIKVNQQRSVVSDLMKHGGKQFGLEAGSKPELLAVIALARQSESVIVCNGYKDREYIRTALLGQQLGHKIYIILEKLSELSIVLEEAKNLAITPMLGMRIRLSSIGKGKWQDTGGSKSKFGFSVAQVLSVIEQLKAHDSLATMQVLHFHLGSQIANIKDIQRGIKECARFYVELNSQGVPIHTIDVGGGLGVDYEGSNSRSDCSKNYSIQEYANNIVYTLNETCIAHNIPCPHIITESGRALTAHHAVLITNVIDVESPANIDNLVPVTSEQSQLLKDLWYGLEHISPRNALESYHDACHWMDEVNSLYIHGVVSINERAQAEQLYYATLQSVQSLLKHSVRSHREVLDELHEKLADKYYCNFSLFQSLPDVWAIDQIFPIIPITGLDKTPSQRGIIQDITCDSDGRIEHYIDNQGVETSLPLLPFDPKTPYLLGIFLIGAYQEILGDMHNLFGDTNSVNVKLRTDGSYTLSKVSQGDKVEDMLAYVGYTAKELLQSYQKQAARSHLSTEETQSLVQELMAGLYGYTYLED